MTAPTDPTAPDPKPELALNRHGRTVADSLNGFIGHAATAYRDPIRLDVASAYFNLGGYGLLADSLDLPAATRILLGAEPAVPENRARRLRGPEAESANPERAEGKRLAHALDRHDDVLVKDRNLLGFTHEIDSTQRRLVDWLRSPTVQVRRLGTRFLHGKAFLAGTHTHGVVVGSSNFTYAGLARNAELNLGSYSPTAVRGVQDWFDELWAEADDYDLAAVFEQRFAPHSPWIVYLRMLWERYGDELEKESEGSPIQLTQFQTDGLWRAKRILGEHHGVLIADEVGLGKTFLAGALIEEAVKQNRQRVLVVAPATLRDGPWRAFIDRHMLYVKPLSFEELAADRQLNPETGTSSKLDNDKNDYAMVVIDEAHNLRNPSTQRAAALRKLLEGSPPKKLVLLTATPVNNSLWDLYHQLGYFIRNDAAFAPNGIPSLQRHFADAMAVDPDDLSPDLLFDVLDSVAVRRTRKFVKRWYPHDQITLDSGETQHIVFPTPRVLKVEYDFDSVLPGFFDRIAKALHPDSDADDPDVLSLARYEPSSYLLEADDEGVAYERRIAGLLRSGLLKRFESSPHAFAGTCERMAASCDAFVSLLDQGQVAVGEALADWAAADSDDADEIDKWLDHHAGPLTSADLYDSALLRERASADSILLRSLGAEAAQVSRSMDPNLAALASELATIAAEAAQLGIGEDDTRDRRKVLIFSYFADTVDWIHDYLVEAVAGDDQLAAYRGRIVSLAGSSGARSKEDAVWGFAPATADAPPGRDEDSYDILVCTDVLAEGVNLQQAQHVINYDLPWNPMRLVQRHGRIDRIGSHHREVFVRCVFPDSRLDEMLELEERLHSKIKQAAASIGAPQVLPRQQGREQTFSETREEIERLRNQEAGIFEEGRTARGAMSGEEFRQELRSGIAERRQEAFEALPWGAGSGMAALPGALRAGRRGYVFCLRVADHDDALFRYVELDLTEASADAGTPMALGGAETGTASQATGGADAAGLAADAGGKSAGGVTVLNKTLDCLELARPAGGFDTPRVLDDATAERAFDAWEAARADVVAGWNHLSDKANIEPRIPKALRTATEILRTSPPAGFTQERIDAAMNALSAPLPERTARSIRAAMQGSENPADQAAKIMEVVETLGLPPYAPPEPLPFITADDVHLVCWQALTPADPT